MFCRKQLTMLVRMFLQNTLFCELAMEFNQYFNVLSSKISSVTLFWACLVGPGLFIWWLELPSTFLGFSELFRVHEIQLDSFWLINQPNYHLLALRRGIVTLIIVKWKPPWASTSPNVASWVLSYDQRRT